MFKDFNPLDPRVTHGKYNSMVDESNCSEPNISISWEQGYMFGDKFKSLGYTGKCFKDEKDEDGNIISAKYTELVDFVFKTSRADFIPEIEHWLENNI